MVREARGNSVYFQRDSIDATVGRLRKMHKDSPEIMYEEVDVSGRGKRGMQTL